MINLIKWSDFICLEDKMDKFNAKKDNIKANINNLFYFFKFRIVERHIIEIKFTWDDSNFIKRKRNKDFI